MRRAWIGLSAWVALSAPVAGERLFDHTDEVALQTACEASGHDAAMCSCVAREANSRFDDEQLDIVGHAAPRIERISHDPDLAHHVPALGRLDPEARAQLEQRAEIADVVIRQACGIGLRFGTAGPSGP